ncbi:unnamed protein product [Rotaria sordida]|uniref:Uncharacterized protein n=1 Tax=Rotaria sordida TaxID=392033 RepID=A0A814E097_9BILA|nr:unnamed protein product [Rotaria sordida]CAF0961403.1 unnamed protein product [Rotaria sordida]CAF3549506.1 unnamed protein product [Rotaria sordida]
MGNTCTSAKAEPTIKPITEPPNATRTKSSSEGNPTISIIVSEEQSPISTSASEENPTVSKLVPDEIRSRSSTNATSIDLHQSENVLKIDEEDKEEETTRVET